MRSTTSRPSLTCRKAQSLVECAIVFGVVTVTAAGIGLYVKRGLQARYKTVVDAAATVGGTRNQYEPYYTTSQAITTQDSLVKKRYQPGGQVLTKDSSTSVTDPGASQTVGIDVTADNQW